VLPPAYKRDWGPAAPETWALLGDSEAENNWENRCGKWEYWCQNWENLV